MQSLNRVTRFWPHRVSDGERGNRGGRREEVDGGLTARRGAVGRFADGRVRRDIQPTQHRRPAHVELPPFDNRANAMSGNGFELVGLRHGDLLLFRALHDALCDRVLRVAFDGSGQAKRFVRLETAISRDIHDAEFAPRQGSGLVEHHGRQMASFLQPAAVPHQQARTGTERRRDGNDQRHRESECMRTRDDEHGDDALDGEGACCTECQPSDQGDASRDNGNDRQQKCGPVRECLRARA